MHKEATIQPPIPEKFSALVKSVGSVPIALAVTVLLGVSFFGSLELLGSIFFTFRRYQGKYFWCMLVATLGVLLYAIASFLMLYYIGNAMFSLILCLVGWVGMVTGQALVLHSRLHLIVRNQRKLKLVLIMIITVGVVVHSTQSALAIKVSFRRKRYPGSIHNANNAICQAVQVGFAGGKYTPRVWGEKVSITHFVLQEITISMIYLLETQRFMKPGSAFRWKGSRRVMKHLILTHVFIILMDRVLLALEWSQLWGLWCAFKGVLYSTKLKIEFRILNQLKEFTTNQTHTRRTENESRWTIGRAPFRLNGMEGNIACVSRIERESCQKTPEGQIMRTTQVVVQNDEGDEKVHDSEGHISDVADEIHAASKASSEIEFMSRGA